jgi:hypothetical protein
MGQDHNQDMIAYSHNPQAQLLSGEADNPTRIGYIESNQYLLFFQLFP